MRRDTFIKSLAALAAAGALPQAAHASVAMKMMIPANPGGGWDTTGRALGKALTDSGAASTVTFDNKVAPPVPLAWRSSSMAARAIPMP